MSQAFLRCEPCNKSFSGPEPYTQHVMSKQHLKRVKSGSPPVSTSGSSVNQQQQHRCELCQINLSGPEPLLNHVNGAKHKAMINKRRIVDQHGAPAVVGSGPAVQLNLTCGPCGKCFSGPESYEQHLNSKKHQRKVELADIQDRLTPQQPPSCPPAMENPAVPAPEPAVPNAVLYPRLPQPGELAGIPTRAGAKQKVGKKPTGCLTVFKCFSKKKKSQVV